MKRMLTLAAVAALAAPAYAQNPPVRTRTETQAPTVRQAEGRAVAGQNVNQPAAGQVGNRPGAGRSVPETEVGQVGVQPGAGQIGPLGVAGRGQMAGVSDGLFAAAAADSGLSELTLSQLGAQRATDPELRQFSQRMIEEHTRLNNELRSLAAQKGIRIPEMVDVRSQFCAQSLAGLSGEKFDQCYAKAQLVGHMEAVAAFEAEAERGLDPDMRAMAAKALPKIKSHLEMIKPIAKKYMKEGESEEPSRIGKPGGHPIR